MMEAVGYYFGRFAPTSFVRWWLRVRHGVIPFEPCVIQFEDSPRIEMCLKDCFMVWDQWGTEGVQIARDENGEIVAIQIPGLHT